MESWLFYHIIAIWLALCIDWLIGDPEHFPHPVRWFGKLITFFDRKLNKGKHRKRNGFVAAMSMQLIVVIATVSIVLLAYTVDVTIGILLEAMLIATSISPRNLKEAALRVYEPLQQNDIKEARHKLSWIVGRDTDQLSTPEIVRGTIETVSENTSDGVTAPLFYAWIGGAPLAVLYRFVNTCDSMLGYRNEKYELFGFAAAKIDDVWNLIPARITGFISLFVYPSRFFRKRTLVKKWRSFATCHPSPNSGYLEAATALLLGIELGGKNTYKGVSSFRSIMGEKKVEKKPAHILDSITIMYRTTFVFACLLTLLGGVFFAFTSTWC
ncbi:adenosylcobinamide-phosphate synthase CbiB [Massilibacterium senegalense]|uniref:adenosylcobinamide-phosphate synthase CbiB n=1 Tax=Massilibacterium senegalense TaxID=1632858 RepID=UPI000785E3EE|nr:adenosylcobinamide-phosphate synthase CbiB [Massilibacterium senegalense]